MIPLGDEVMARLWKQAQKETANPMCHLDATEMVMELVAQEAHQNCLRQVIEFIDSLDDGLRSSASWRTEVRKFRQALRKEELWAWHDYREDSYCMVYNRRFLVEMCSPDGFRKKTELGEGKIVKLRVLEVTDG